MKFIRLHFMLITFLLATSISTFAWRGRDHYWINLAAAVQNEEQIEGFEQYTSPLAKLGHLPDVWKNADPDEGMRHFIDLEKYGYPLIPLDRHNAGLFDREFEEYNPSEGIAPWVIMDALNSLTEALATTNWPYALRIAGAMGHYAADIHMPLHTTANYNGQESGNDGVHGRWESEMPKRKTRPRRIAQTTPVYLNDPWAAITNWVAESHALVPALLHTDTVAAETAGDDYQSNDYYDILWRGTRDIYCDQMDLAAHHLASLWYTAWVNAGKPEAVALTNEIIEASIYYSPAKKNPFSQYSTWGFFILFGLAGMWVIWKSLRK